MVYLIGSALISSFNKTGSFNESSFRNFLVCSIPDILSTIWELWNINLESQTVRREQNTESKRLSTIYRKKNSMLRHKHTINNKIVKVFGCFI